MSSHGLSLVAGIAVGSFAALVGLALGATVHWVKELLRKRREERLMAEILDELP